MEISRRVQFLVRNGIKGMIWLAILLAGYFIFDHYVISKNPELWLEHFYSQPEIIYLIFIASESFIGILPPELFMIWAFNKGGITHYIFSVALFASISYSLGYINYLVGKFLYNRVIFRYLRKRYFKESWEQLRKYGLFLIIVAAITPVPWAAVCLLVGSANYPAKKFFLYALTRLARFVVYGFVVYQSHQF